MQIIQRQASEYAVRGIPLPDQTSSYTVISHGLAIDESRKKLTAYGMNIIEERYLLAKDGQIAQGKYLCELPQTHPHYQESKDLGFQMLLAWVNSYDKSTRFKCVVGVHFKDAGVDIIKGETSGFRRKHTGKADEEVVESLDQMLQKNIVLFGETIRDKDAMEKCEFDSVTKASYLGMAFIVWDLLNGMQMNALKADYKKPTFQPDSKTAWSFYVQILKTLHTEHPQSYMETLRGLHIKMMQTVASGGYEEKIPEEFKIPVCEEIPLSDEEKELLDQPTTLQEWEQREMEEAAVKTQEWLDANPEHWAEQILDENADVLKEGFAESFVEHVLGFPASPEDQIPVVPVNTDEMPPLLLDQVSDEQEPSILESITHNQFMDPNRIIMGCDPIGEVGDLHSVSAFKVGLDEVTEEVVAEYHSVDYPLEDVRCDIWDAQKEEVVEFNTPIVIERFENGDPAMSVQGAIMDLTDIENPKITIPKSAEELEELTRQQKELNKLDEPSVVVPEPLPNQIDMFTNTTVEGTPVTETVFELSDEGIVSVEKVVEPVERKWEKLLPTETFDKTKWEYEWIASENAFMKRIKE